MAIDKSGEEWEEYNNAVKWMALTVTISLAVTIILALISMPLGYLIGSGISQKTFAVVSKFMSTVFNDPGYLFSRYWSWFRQLMNYNGPFMAADSSVYYAAGRAADRRADQPLSLPVQYPRFRPPGHA